VNFSQGEMLMVSAFTAWSAQHGGLPLPLALVAGIAAGGLLALLIERAIIRRAVAATHWDVLIITLGLSLVLRAAAGLVWTNEELPFPALFSNRPIAVGPVRLAPVSLGVIAASLILMVALVALFRATRFGRAMRAVAQNQTAARLVGIGVERVYSGAWVLAALVGGIAGVLIAPLTFLSTKMGLVAINGFTAAVLGGFGSLPGAVVGGMLLGVIENLAPLYLPTGIRYSVPFLVMIAILVARPRGLFGRVERRKV
jgi:branched-chain amino acid transport system permease protein